MAEGLSSVPDEYQVIGAHDNDIMVSILCYIASSRGTEHSSE